MTELRHLVNGFQVSQAIHVAAALGIPDLLADGPRTSEELADAAGADPDALYRLLRALASIGVLEEDGERAFSLTPFGEPLRSDVPDSLHGWVSFVGRPYYWQAWGAAGREHAHGRERVPSRPRHGRVGVPGAPSG